MNVSSIRATLERFGIPNLVAGMGILFIVSLPIAIIFALSAGKTATESVQITYQLALVLAGFIGLPLAVWRSWTAHRQAATGLEQLKGLQRQIALAEAGADADRLQKGAEMLQAESIAVRIAGVAILREISANVNHRYAQEAFSVLASFVRSSSEAEEALDRKTPEDLVEAFQSVAATRAYHKNHFGRVCLRGAVLNGIILDNSAYSECYFHACSIRKSFVSDECFSTFEDCRFYDVEFIFEELSFADFKNCRFDSSKFSGKLDVNTLVNCTFFRLKADKDFIALGDAQLVKKAIQIIGS